MSLAGGMLLLGAIVVQLYASSQADIGEYLRAEMFGIAEDHAMVAIRTGAAFATAGLLIVAIGFVMGALDRRNGNDMTVEG